MKLKKGSEFPWITAKQLLYFLQRPAVFFKHKDICHMVTEII